MRLIVIALILGFSAAIAFFIFPDPRAQMIYNIQRETKWFGVQALCSITVVYAVPIYLLLLLAHYLTSIG